jgi:cold shock protein
MFSRIIMVSLMIAIPFTAIGYVISSTDLLPTGLDYFTIAFMTAALSALWISKYNTANEISHNHYAQNTPASRQSKISSKLKKERGSVKWFSTSKGFGFITRDNGEDIFVHFRSITGSGHRILHEGQRVEFAVAEGSKGLQAEEVSTIN